MLAVICLICVSFGIVLQTIPPVLSLIVEDLHISNAEVGLFSAIVNLPGIFLIIPLSMFYNRIGIKRIGIISSLLIIAGSAIVFFSDNYVLLLTGRTIVGIGAASMAIVGLQSIALWFIGGRIGLAMGIFSSLMPLSGVICFISFGAAGLAWGWRSVILIDILVSIVALIVYAAFFKLPPSNEPATQNSTIIHTGAPLKLGWPIWVLAAEWGFVNLGLFAVGTFTPDFLYQNSFDLRIAGIISSIMMFAAFALNPFVGLLLDRIKRKELFGVLIGIVCTVDLILLPLNVNYIIITISILGIFCCSFAPLTFTLSPRLVKSEYMPLAFGIVSTTSYMGMFSGPYLTGFILDTTHNYTYGFWSIALFFLLAGAMMAALFFNSRKREHAAQKVSTDN